MQEQNIESNIPATDSLTTRIITPKKKTKHYDSFGALIPQDDLDIQNDLAAGRKIVYYHEDKVEEKKELRKRRR